MPDILKERVVAAVEEVERLDICRYKPGNFSIYDPETGYVVITPSGVARDVLGPEHVCAMDPSDKVIERAAETKPPSEAMIHLYIYKERRDIRVIVHTHARHSTVSSAMNKPVMPIAYECAYLGKTGTAPVAPYGRAGTVDLAEKVAEVMREYDCRLMEGHGAIAADKDMDAAFSKAQYVEEIAEMYYITLAAENGTEPYALSMGELQKWAYPKEITLQKGLRGSTKKIINALEAYTDDMLCGIYVAHPDMLKYVEDDLRRYYMAKKKQGKVAIITGGGTGHLPLFLRYVGESLLDGCGVGGVLQSPSPEQLYNVAKKAEAGAGVLSPYGNYTGDIMNFDTVAEMPDMGDIRTASAVRADGVFSNKDIQVRQGAAEVFLMYKYVGAMVVRMGTLGEVSDAAKEAKESTRTVGFTLMPCVIPEIGRPNLTPAEDEMVFGMGIHGEPGVRNDPVKTTNDPAEESVGEISEGMPLNPGEEVCLPISGLGATSQEELYILLGSVHRILEEEGIKVYRTSVGEYATSMKMAGTSTPICRTADQEMKQWVDMPVYTPLYTQA